MSADRELLELAAKAAEIQIGTWSNCQAGGFLSLDCLPTRRERFWNPLTDDGDALRLAVKLSINIEYMKTQGREAHGVNCWPYGRGDCAAVETEVGDPYAATRRAIVRAAAEIGRAMS